MLSDETMAEVLACMSRTIARARQEGGAAGVSLVDAGGHQIAFVRDPNAKLVTCVTATGKARCAVMFGRDTEQTVAIARDNPLAFQTFVAAAEMPFVIGDGGFVIPTPRGLWGVGVAGVSNEVDHKLGRQLADEIAALIA